MPSSMGVMANPCRLSAICRNRGRFIHYDQRSPESHMIWPWKKDGESESAGELRLAGGSWRHVLHDFVAALPDPVLLLDQNGIVAAANRRALDILDFDP